MTTITITKSQVRSLRNEAYEAGDTVMVETCDIALGHWSDQPADWEDDAVVIRDAIAECKRVIREAAAQVAR